MTRHDMSQALGISMPTTLQNVEKLLARGLIEEAGESASTGGRRAKVFRLSGKSELGIGIQVTRRHLRLALVNLFGEVLAVRKEVHPFCDEPSWYRELKEMIEHFLEEAGDDRDKIVGAGLSFPGIIDQDNNLILHSHVFNLTNVSLDRFIKAVPLPLLVINDANCACYAERRRDMESWFYLSLNESVGGAFMMDQKLVSGKNWRTGEAGHVVIHPGGRRCYCGKDGCADAYLSSTVLLTQEEELDDFFARLADKDKEAQAIWDEYMENLALLVSNINMLLDTEIVLGGDIGARLGDYVVEIGQRTRKYDLFSRDVDYISSCKCRDHIFLVGAALQAIDFFEEMMTV